MSEKENKEIIRRLQEEMLMERKLELIDELYAADVVDHSAPPGFAPGRKGIKQMMDMYHSAFDIEQVQVEDRVAEGDKVVSRCTIRGTHTGEYLGIAPTGKQITIIVLCMDRIVDGKVVEHWEHFDPLVLMQLVGLVPPHSTTEQA